MIFLSNCETKSGEKHSARMEIWKPSLTDEVPEIVNPILQQWIKQMDTSTGEA